MASTYLTRTYQSGGNRKKWTMSMWVKRSGLGATNLLFQSYVSTYTWCPFLSDDRLEFQDGNGGNKVTKMKFRDTNAWYHIVVAIDTDLATADDRYKIYVNGNRITDFDTSTNPSQGYEGEWNKAQLHNIGRHHSAGNYHDGYMSHIHFCDGYQYQASDFGSFDSTTGEWKINTSPSVSYGTTGFFILKDGPGVTDQSPNSNDWTANGSLTKSEDNPSNIFCTLNPLQEPDPAQAAEYTFGNTKFAGNWNHWQRAYGTIGANTGKFYYEFKCLNDDGTAGHLRVGWDSVDLINDGQDSYYSGLTLDKEGKLRGGILGYNNYDPNSVQMTAAHSGGNFSFTANDILGMAIDIDNNTFSVYKNGNLEINAYSYASNSNCSLLKSKGHFIAPSVNWYSASGNGSRSCFNFGNGYFETTAVSSAGTNASNLGIFEYDVPTGYTAWCTKGLNE